MHQDVYFGFCVYAFDIRFVQPLTKVNWRGGSEALKLVAFTLYTYTNGSQVSVLCLCSMDAPARRCLCSFDVRKTHFDDNKNDMRSTFSAMSMMRRVRLVLHTANTFPSVNWRPVCPDVPAPSFALCVLQQMIFNVLVCFLYSGERTSDV